MRVLVTGGAGFIGSALVRHLVAVRGDDVCTVDKLTYAGNPANLASVRGRASHRFEALDICDAAAMRKLVADFAPDALMHLAAESHVDRSIEGPADFVQTNIVGTCTLLEAIREHRASGGRECRFIHVSTDEVYGSLGAEGQFDEESPYRPNSPYSASKAAADHLARAWCNTFNLPVIVTNCSNNYGPYQFPEKLIPVVILRALEGERVPVYGDGLQVRDWLHVEDHVRGLVAVLDGGRAGRTYNIGGNCEKTNLEVVQSVLRAVASSRGESADSLLGLIEFVADRPGHDRRYALDATRITAELGWQPAVDFESGIADTVEWYAANADWCAASRRIYDGARLGLKEAAGS
ncbi:MAG: dTDP-glucose 4,6-dehydratase [Gammaproteobacteria bacterium]|nr:dTDP-glucose 4,6-dehydratase [Gammaproteobacteria bacterium]